MNPDNIPQFVPDDRQSLSTKMISDIVDQEIKNGADKVETVNMGRGWPASYVNLGWLKSEIEDQQPENCDEIEAFILVAVQRLKMINIKKNEE